LLKILSWNIRQGGGSRINKIVNAILNEKADIVVLSEYRNNDSGMRLRHNFLRIGYRFVNVTAAKKNDNAVAIFSKLSSNQYLYAKANLDFPHNIVCSSYDAFNIFGVYLPHKKKHKLFDFLLTEMQKGKPSILIGDYNSAKNFKDQKGDSFWYTDKLVALENNGFIDAFRYLHKDITEYSWYSHGGNGYRYDHTYIHESLIPILKDCYYIHKWREVGLSDHSPMVLELG